jgi:hypothetical protein
LRWYWSIEIPFPSTDELLGNPQFVSELSLRKGGFESRRANFIAQCF